MKLAGAVSRAQLNFSVAGIRMQVESLVPGLRFRTDLPKQKFFSHAGEPHISVSVELTDFDPAETGDLIFDSGSVWKLYRSANQLSFHLSSPAVPANPYKIARFTEDLSQGHIFLNPGSFSAADEIDPLEYPLDELLLISYLSQGRGVEIHGCGLIGRSGRGYLFAGQSGGGKTTMAGIFDGHAEILSDDRIVLTRDANGVRMHGTPWHGDAGFAEPRSSRVDAIFILGHAPKNTITKLKPAIGAGQLYARSFPTYYSLDGIAFSLRFLDETVQQVPCYALDFVPDKNVIEFIENL